jgi:hypothetical protein
MKRKVDATFLAALSATFMIRELVSESFFFELAVSVSLWRVIHA